MSAAVVGNSVRQILRRIVRCLATKFAIPAAVAHTLLAKLLLVHAGGSQLSTAPRSPSVMVSRANSHTAGLVERGRQQITILDRQGLIEASCECYQLVRERIAFHLPRTYP